MPLYKNMLCLHLECNSGLPVVRREARIVKSMVQLRNFSHWKKQNNRGGSVEVSKSQMTQRECMDIDFLPSFTLK